MLTRFKAWLYRILTPRYEAICHTQDCRSRKSPSSAAVRRALHTRIIQVVFLMLVSGFMGGNFALLVRGQSPSPAPQQITPRVESLQTQVSVSQVRIDTLLGIQEDQGKKIDHIGTEVATMEGIGMGFSGLLIVLQVAQMVMGKRQGI